MVLRLSKLEFSALSCPLSSFTAKRSSSWLTFLLTSLPLFNILLASVLNSSSSKIFVSFSSLGFSSFSFSRSRSSGTSVLMVARNFDILMSSTAPSTFSFILPFNLSVLARRLSTLPNSLISLAAVFSPTPGQPGKLSAESPISASRSITCSCD